MKGETRGNNRTTTTVHSVWSAAPALEIGIMEEDVAVDDNV